jgi:adenylate cyclase
MATITVRGKSDRHVEASAAVSILNNLLRAGVKISHLCGGRAVCGTCRIRILSGAEHLSPMTDAERRRLSADGRMEEDVRLACQTHTRGDLEIRILAPGR